MTVERGAGYGQPPKRRSNGSTRVVDAVGSRGAAPRSIWCCAAAQDGAATLTPADTRLLEAQRRAETAEALLATVAEHILDGIALHDADGRLMALSTKTVRAKGARVEHDYELRRDQDLLAAGHTIVACVDTRGRARRLPTVLLESAVAE